MTKCLDSICQQSYGDFQVICIDDGSTDNSLEILNEYKSKYAFLEIYTQENQGPSAARNKGILLSKGEYILFVDSDDWYERCTVLEELDKYILSQNRIVDCVHFCGNTNFKYAADYNEYSYDSFDTGIQLLSKYSSKKMRLFFGACYAFCYRTKVLKDGNIFFNEDLKCREDALFVFDFLNKVNFCIVYPHSLYYYNVHEESIITSPKLQIRRAEDAILFCEILLTRSYISNKDIRRMALHAYSTGITTLLYNGQRPIIKYKMLFLASATNMKSIVKKLLILICPKLFMSIFMRS